MPDRHAVRSVLAALLYLAAWPALAANELPVGILELDGRDAPALELENLDGERWDIDRARGGWVFVHFWASWCGPCREEMPTIQAIVDVYNTSFDMATHGNSPSHVSDYSIDF